MQRRSDRNHNPQAAQMADPSMVRCLKAQAEAIWPQESALFRAYELPVEARVLDVGCGTGEITRRLAEVFPRAKITGVDLIEAHLQRAVSDSRRWADRARFLLADAFHLPFADDVFDLAVCRHMVQAVPRPERVLREMVRVTRSGGRLHLLAEDYAMMHFHPVRRDTDAFWREGPVEFARATGTDLRVGRKAYTLLHREGLRSLRVDYVVVDTLRVPREVFAAIWCAWRDGYTEIIAEHSAFTREEVHAYFKEMLHAIRSPEGYAVWQVPVLSGVVP